MRTLAALSLACLLGLAVASCSSRAAEPARYQLPAIGSLELLRRTHAKVGLNADVLAPLLSGNTAPAGSELSFSATPLAYAVYALDPGLDLPLNVEAAGTGALHLSVADYGTGHWHEFADLAGTASQDLAELEDPHSGTGAVFVAVVCDPGTTGALSSLQLNIDDGQGWDLYIVADDTSITVEWDDVGADSYHVLRSTLPDDPAPYEVGTVVEDHSGSNSFTEALVEHDDGTWITATRDNGTPGNVDDDYPAIAPGIPYYYSIVPLFGATEGLRSPEATTEVEWGARRSGRRLFPDTTGETRMFADQLNVAGMTASQNQWCAENFVGTQKIVKRRADELRAYNQDFMVLGYHLGAGAGDIGNASGNDWDDDADWPYVDRHESWFHHLGTSTQPHNRVDQLDYHWKVMDPDSVWQDYLAANLLQTMGEDHFDGWFVDSCHQPWNTDPSQWWEGPDMFTFWTPQLHELLDTLNAAADGHEISPYIIPNAGGYITTVSDIRYYGCDGIMVEGHAHNAPGSYFSTADWVLQHDRILDHQAHGQYTILQTGVNIQNVIDRAFVYGCYLLVRGPGTYINWLGEGEDNGIGQFYPEWGWDAGTPVGGQPALIDDLKEVSGVYRRDFSDGMVIVNPTDAIVPYGAPPTYEQMVIIGGGNINPDGSVNGTIAWVAAPGLVQMQPHTAMLLKE